MTEQRADAGITAYSAAGTQDDRPPDEVEHIESPNVLPSSSHSRMLWTYRVIALALGTLQAWAFRYEATPDGVSYLDVADAYRDGRWADAPNGYWSPMYSWLLAMVGAVLRVPSAYDYALAHVVNFLGYVAALAAFEYLLRGIDELDGLPSTRSTERRRDWWTLGYALFLWSTLGLIGLGVTAPDILLAAFAFTVAGILTRATLPGKHLIHGALLGPAAAAGYLSKAAFLPVFVVVVCIAGVLWWRRTRQVLPPLLAVVCFAITATPYAAALSKAKGRLTFGDQGPIAYAWIVNGVHGQVHWQGGPPAAGAPAHPTRRISTSPDAFEFATPLVATYPPWYDPSYWYDGVRPRWDLLMQLRIASRYVPLLLELFAPLVLVVVATLVAVRRRRAWESIERGWGLIVPGAVAIAMYAGLFLETRYIAPFVVMVWIGTLLILEPLMPAAWRRGLFVGAAAILVATTLPTLVPKVRSLLPGYRNSHWDDAAFVLQSGVQPNDRVAVIGDGVFAYWARLARVHIVAEVPSHAAAGFWSSNSDRRAALVDRFARAGATAIVAQGSPPPTEQPGWRIGVGGRLAVLRLRSAERE